MLEWIKAIEDSLKFAKELLQREAKAKEVASLPYRIRVRLSPSPLPLTPLALRREGCRCSGHSCLGRPRRNLSHPLAKRRTRAGNH
jgi:hypothetical protein